MPRELSSSVNISTRGRWAVTIVLCTLPRRRDVLNWHGVASCDLGELLRAAQEPSAQASTSAHRATHGAVTSVLCTLPRLQDGFNWHGVLQATTASCFEPRVSRALGLYGGRWVFGVYVWLGARSAPQIEAGARFRHASASPKHPNLPACLPACLLPTACDYNGLDCFDPLEPSSGFCCTPPVVRRLLK